MARRWLANALVVCVALGVARSSSAGVVEVQVELPQAARVDLEKAGYRTLVVAPFLAGEPPAGKTDYAFDREASRFFERLLRKETKLEVHDAAGTTLPFDDLDRLADDHGFWQKLAMDLHADLLLSGRVVFQSLNRSGYVENQSRSAITGRVVNDRPTFVYRTGIALSLDLVLIEGSTGDVLYRDRFLKDRTVDGGGGDPLQNFFDLMRGLSPSVLGIVIPQKTVATRYLLD